MEMQLETNKQLLFEESSLKPHRTADKLGAIDDYINQISEQLWQELNETGSSEFSLMRMWK